MKNITFRQLQVFESIARNGSFTAAAEELFLTQPTVSMQIKKLASHIGLPLFEQLGKRIYLTDAGQELLKSAHEISDSFENLDMTISDDERSVLVPLPTNWKEGAEGGDRTHTELARLRTISSPPAIFRIDVFPFSSSQSKT